MLSDQAGCSSNFRLLLLLESSCHRETCRAKSPRTRSFPKFCSFRNFQVTDMSKTIKPAVLLIFVCCCHWSLVVHDKHVGLLWKVTKSSVNRKLLGTNSFLTFCRLRNSLVTHMSINECGCSSNYHQRINVGMCPAISGRYVRSPLKNTCISSNGSQIFRSIWLFLWGHQQCFALETIIFC